MTKDAASRIQSSEANKGGGQVESGGFASRAQVTELLYKLWDVNNFENSIWQSAADKRQGQGGGQPKQNWITLSWFD